jgi:hypothetical protein
MGRACTVCMHQDRDVIDEALVTGTPRRELARRHRLSEGAVRRHHDAHVPETLARAYASRWETVRAESLLGRLDDLAHRTDVLLKKAEAAADLRSAPGLVRELRQTLETMARMTGELRDQAQMVVLADSSAFKAVAAAVLSVLEPHPELRGRVAEALRALPPEPPHQAMGPAAAASEAR